MDDYPEDFINGVTPLIFAVDAVTCNDGNIGADANTSSKKSTAFESFYNYITSKMVKSGKITSKNGNANGYGPTSSSKSKYTVPSPGALPKSHSAANSISKSSDFFAHANVVPVSHRHAFPPSKDPHGSQNSVTKLNNALHAARKQKFVSSHKPYSTINGNEGLTTKSGQNTDSGTNAGVGAGDGVGLINTSANPNARMQTQISPITAILSKSPIQGILPSGWIEKHTHALPSTLLIVTTLDLSNTPYQQALLEKHLSQSIENISGTCARKRASPVHLVCLVKYANKGIGTPKEIAIENERMGSIKSVCRLSNGSVTALHYFEEDQNTIFVQEDFQKMQKAVEGESMLYYLTQVRRCKRKHSMLHHGKFIDLLPFAARYCVKIAVFYEFQSFVDPDRAKKSSKYWAEAYKNIQDYYLHLQKETEINYGGNRSGGMATVHAGRSLMDVERGSQVTGNTSIASIGENIGVGVGFEREDVITESIAIAASLRENNSLKSDHGGEQGEDFGTELPPPPPPLGPPPSSGDGVEVALVYSPNTGGGKLAINPHNSLHQKSKEVSVHVSEDGNIMTHSEDMIHQCRAIADLLNIKLLLTNYAAAINSSSETSVGQDSPEDNTFATIMKQIRTHYQIFLSATPSSASFSGNSVNDAHWYFLSFVARQRLVVSEFLEQHTLKLPSNHFATLDEETLLYCNASDHYISCAQSFLRLGVSVERAQTKYQSNKEGQSENDLNDGRQRFIGCLSNQDLIAAWDEELKHDHNELALAYLQRSIDILNQSNPSDASNFPTSNRKALARAYYLIARIFMKKSDYKSANEYLKLILPMVDSFPSVRIAVEAGIKKCSDECGIEPVAVPSVALFLDGRCNRLLSEESLVALQQSIVGEGKLKVPWPYDAKLNQPFYYSFTFPSCSYALEGDTVAGLLHLHSNLPFPTKIENIHIITNVGSVGFSKNALAQFIQPNETISIFCIVSVPYGCMKNMDGKILERQTIKKQRRNTFGLTKIGGGVYGTDTDNKQSGGLCLSCVEAEFEFNLPHNNKTCLAVSIQNHHRGSFPIPSESESDGTNQKRISLEEDNFVYSAWSRPDVFPMHSGPRCLRILEVQSQLEIIDMTSPLVNSKAMEGTVNRFLLKLRSGSTEKCKDLKMKVKCSSWIHSGNVSDEKVSNVADSHSIDSALLPVLVKSTSSKISSDKSRFVLPGWEMANIRSSENGSSEDDWVPIADNLNCASEMFCSFNLFKQISPSEDIESVHDHIKTKYTVDISYKQIRLDQRREHTHYESVIQTYQGTITWCLPFSTDFRVLSKSVSSPSGSKHPTNNVSTQSSPMENRIAASGKFVAVTCSLQSQEAANNLAAQVQSIDFEAGPQNSDCSISLVRKENTESSVLYEANGTEFCSKLTHGSKLKIAYTVRPKLSPVAKSHHGQLAPTPLGLLKISFKPLPLNVDNGPELQFEDKFPSNHGPLPIEKLPPFRQRGPVVYVEGTPFEASFSTIPSIPRVASPFEVKYNLVNTTNLQQRIKVCMNESKRTSNDMLVSGIVNGELTLGPREAKVIRYSILVSKIGKAVLPALNISSVRYNSWIIRSSQEDCIYILP